MRMRIETGLRLALVRTEEVSDQESSSTGAEDDKSVNDNNDNNNHSEGNDTDHGCGRHCLASRRVSE